MADPKVKQLKAKPADKFTEIAEYLIMKYSIRYNLMRMSAEIFDEESGGFVELDEVTYNTIFIELKQQGFSVTEQVLNKVTASRMIPQVNPLAVYFHELPKWDEETDYIGKLSETVMVENFEGANMDLWHRMLQKFLVSTVATAISNRPGQLCLVLAGPKGVGKSTWLDKLCPPSLSNNLHFTGGIVPKITEKNTADLLAEKFLIHLDDQIQTYTMKDFEHLKSIITSTRITSRKNYVRNSNSRPRRASIIASTNDPSFLVDTANRRYVVFTCVDVDLREVVDRDKVFAQALYLYRKGERYYLNSEEQRELTLLNARYRMPPMEEELVAKYLQPGDEQSPITEWVTVTEIKMYLENQSFQKNLSRSAVGKALREAGCPYKSKNVNGSIRYRYGVLKLGV